MIEAANYGYDFGDDNDDDNCNNSDTMILTSHSVNRHH